LLYKLNSYRYTKEKKSPGTADHVVFLDATDVVLLKPVANILRKWSKLGTRFDIAMPYQDLAASSASSSSASESSAAASEPSVSPAVRFIPGSRLLRAAQFLDAVRNTYLVSFPPARGQEAEGFRDEQRAYARVLSASAGFRPELFKRGSKGFLLRAPVVDAVGGALNGTECADAAECIGMSGADVALLPPVGSATVGRGVFCRLAVCSSLKSKCPKPFLPRLFALTK
jgi:hypothetical protein